MTSQRRQRAARCKPVPASPWVGALGSPCAIEDESAAGIEARRGPASGNRLELDPAQVGGEDDHHHRPKEATKASP